MLHQSISLKHLLCQGSVLLSLEQAIVPATMLMNRFDLLTYRVQLFIQILLSTCLPDLNAFSFFRRHVSF